MDQAASLLGNSASNDSSFPTMTFKQRITGFIICELLGILIQLISFGSLLGMLTGGGPTKFALNYTLGNLVALIGTTFLKGPASQCRSMMEPKRICSSLAYLLSIAGTVVSALVLHSKMLTIIALVVQWLSFLYYCLSYIPFGHKMAKMAIQRASGGSTVL